jgi:F-type H+-transporting ATPase subunit epsilon
MQVIVLAPTAGLFDAAASLVTLPGSEGQFGVGDYHTALVANLAAGDVVISTETGDTIFTIEGGVAEIRDNVCTILAEIA